MGAMIGFIFITRPNDVIAVLDEFARFGLLAALQIRIAQEVDGMGLGVELGHVPFRGVSGGSRRGDIRSDGILPETEAHEDVRRQGQWVGGVWRNGRRTAEVARAPGGGYRAGGGAERKVWRA